MSGWSGSHAQISHDGRPVWKALGTKVDMLTFKQVHVVPRAIVYQEISAVQVFVMRENQTLTSDLTQIFPDPEWLV